jgi:Cu-processing system ATP-binding protein
MIEISQVTKRFGKFVALRDVSLSFERGRVTGIIGPNGSGKSTLIKSILGLVTPTTGTITVNGYLLDGSAEYRQWIGYMPQIARFPQDLKGHEVLAMVKRLRPAVPALERELIDLFGLEHELPKRIRALSGGNRQKLSAVVSCMYNPELLIFDEPTAGLDPLSSARLKKYIVSLRAKERTVLITTHIMSDLEELADDVVLLLEGKVRFAGSVRDLKMQTNEPRLEAAVARLLERSAA